VVLLAHIKLGWKGLPITNALAYLTSSLGRRNFFDETGVPYRVGSGLTCKYKTKLERLAKDKHFSLFGLFIDDGVHLRG
jgi:hypothetical protein